MTLKCSRPIAYAFNRASSSSNLLLCFQVCEPKLWQVNVVTCVTHKAHISEAQWFMTTDGFITCSMSRDRNTNISLLGAQISL